MPAQDIFYRGQAKCKYFSRFAAVAGFYCKICTAATVSLSLAGKKRPLQSHNESNRAMYGQRVTLEQQFGKLIRRRRLAAELSQEALAHAAGLHRTYISLLERGQRMPSIGIVQMLAEALGTTMAELMADLEDSA